MIVTETEQKITRYPDIGYLQSAMYIFVSVLMALLVYLPDLQQQ